MGHYYAKDGSPAHFQPDGKNTTLRHAKTQDLVPSVTGILDVVASPGLTTYFINQHLEAAWGLYDFTSWPEQYSYKDWCKEVRQLAGDHAKQARDKGSAIHHQLDVWYSESTEELDPALAPYLNAVTAALKDVYGIEMGNCTPERTFATDEYGGAVDLSTDNLVIDFKFKSGGWDTKKDGTPKKMWYESHVAQLAAYREGLGLPEAKVANVFIGPDAEVYIHEWTEDQVQYGMRYFNACLNLWKIKNLGSL